ncbi:unnamed protein product [Echinostoma caproni]|uniref:Uncharacterized protein n=1 Tax=Echinostoma caproni TaxID=27848 RepID=A0A183AWG6_9TREM|nr:unnamed protein product [Echinostoma caproni]
MVGGGGRREEEGPASTGGSAVRGSLDSPVIGKRSRTLQRVAGGEVDTDTEGPSCGGTSDLSDGLGRSLRVITGRGERIRSA